MFRMDWNPNVLGHMVLEIMNIFFFLNFILFLNFT